MPPLQPHRIARIVKAVVLLYICLSAPKFTTAQLFVAAAIPPSIPASGSDKIAGPDGLLDHDSHFHKYPAVHTTTTVTTKSFACFTTTITATVTAAAAVPTLDQASDSDKPGAQEGLVDHDPHFYTYPAVTITTVTTRSCGSFTTTVTGTFACTMVTDEKPPLLNRAPPAMKPQNTNDHHKYPAIHTHSTTTTFGDGIPAIVSCTFFAPVTSCDPTQLPTAGFPGASGDTIPPKCEKQSRPQGKSTRLDELYIIGIIFVVGLLLIEAGEKYLMKKDRSEMDARARQLGAVKVKPEVLLLDRLYWVVREEQVVRISDREVAGKLSKESLVEIGEKLELNEKLRSELRKVMVKAGAVVYIEDRDAETADETEGVKYPEACASGCACKRILGGVGSEERWPSVQISPGKSEEVENGEKPQSLS